MVAGAATVASGAAGVVELRRISKRYGRRTALEGLDLSVAAGEVVGLLGPNGAGKTTAVKVILGLVRPSAGSGRLLGRSIADPAARQGVGYLPELFRFPPWLTGREVVAYHAELAGVPAHGREAAVAGALANADLASRGDDLVGGYSKGMQQRLGLAVALLGDPAFVVLDEPSTGLDPIGRQELRGMIRGLRESGTAILLNSHQLGEVEQVCDRVAIMHEGRVLADGPLVDLLEPAGVRIRATNVTAAGIAAAARVADVRTDGDDLVLGAADAESAPAVVRALVEQGASIHRVETMQTSLEDRFRRLLEGGGR